MEAINFSCQGESHIATGKVCQDYSYSKVYEDGSAIAIVSDGHGGKRYFRSDVGSKIATEVAEESVRTFLSSGIRELILSKPFTQRSSIATQIDNGDFVKQTPIENAFRQLFGSIIYQWNTRVTEHSKCNPISESEKSELEPRWIETFEKGESLEKVYGCTLIVYASTPEFWIAFQIGDGKCFTFDKHGIWAEPIPWDDKCFLNRTTSICDSSAIDEFRYCFQGDGEFPIAAILGSDGIDDSFGAPENQANFYVQILKSLSKDGLEDTIKEVETTLPQLSKIGSKDDMSLAMIFDDKEVPGAFTALVEWQIKNLNSLLSEEREKIRLATSKIAELKSRTNLTRQAEIDLRYALADEKRAKETSYKLSERLNSLRKEIGIESDTVEDGGSYNHNGDETQSDVYEPDSTGTTQVQEVNADDEAHSTKEVDGDIPTQEQLNNEEQIIPKHNEPDRSLENLD